MILQLETEDFRPVYSYPIHRLDAPKPIKMPHNGGETSVIIDLLIVL